MEEKLKIGNMLRELARAQRQGQQAARERQEYQARLSKLRGQNENIIRVRHLALSHPTARCAP